MTPKVSFILDGKIISIDFSKESNITPTTTVLNYLRSLPNHKGVKEGCAEGDCGACTIVLGELTGNNKIRYQAVNSCLIFLPKLHRKWLITVENLKIKPDTLHPVQQALVDFHGSQCGYCTPGFVMSLFDLYKSDLPNTREVIEDALTGNLCRCTGYQPIIEASEQVLQKRLPDQFSRMEEKRIKQILSITNESIQINTKKQKYFLPLTLEELLQIKKENDNAILINGATDIALRVTKGHELLPEIIDTNQIDELKIIKEADDHIYFGSGVVLNQVMKLSQKWFPALYDMCVVFGSRQIREMATIGGNLGTASPIGDLLPVLAAYGAEIITISSKAERSIPMDEFVRGYRETALQDDEVIKGVKIPKIDNSRIIKSYKVSKRKDLDISTVSVAFNLSVDETNHIKDIQIIYGGMAELTKHARKAEQFLQGKPWSRETVEQAMHLIAEEFKPISDARSGAEFRTLAAKNLLFKFWMEINLEKSQNA